MVFALNNIVYMTQISILAKIKKGIEQQFNEQFVEIVANNIIMSLDPNHDFDTLSKIVSAPYPVRYILALQEVAWYTMKNINNIGILAITGSWGRLDIVDWLSDLDIFIVLHWNPDIPHITEGLESLRFIHGIKVGFTIISEAEFQQSTNTKAKICYQIKNLNHLNALVLYKQGIAIPKYSKQLLIQRIYKEIDLYIDKSLKIISDISDRISLQKGLKRAYTVMKLLLILRGYDSVEWYLNVRKMFYAIFLKDNFLKIPQYNYSWVLNIQKKKNLLNNFVSQAKAKVHNMNS